MRIDIDVEFRRRRDVAALEIAAAHQHDFLDALGNLRLERRQRLARQRRARLGGIALPGQSVGNRQARSGQQGIGLVSPFRSDGLLALGALDFINALADGAGGALVAHAQLLEHLLQLLGRRLGGQPIAHARGALARGGGREGATGQRIERMRLRGLGRGRVHFRSVGHFAAGRKRKHG
ncbi:hypothetical protein SDC9_200333 [bioreactor metagenome]|uniref:Uncharacterized protein n=1 Tax=bioreactor metagenome TaxID=1076179 RepID=A0A645IMZ4_9ZZZZ